MALEAGPVVPVGLMAFAVVASPIPSAPVALASGAAYGHAWGTVWVVLVAFGRARFLGFDAIRHWTGPGIDRGIAGLQNALTAIVPVSRLLPFVSFDAVSCAAGLSRLGFWRFAMATLAGIGLGVATAAPLVRAARRGADGTGE